MLNYPIAIKDIAKFEKKNQERKKCSSDIKEEPMEWDDEMRLAVFEYCV